MFVLQYFQELGTTSYNTIIYSFNFQFFFLNDRDRYKPRRFVFATRIEFFLLMRFLIRYNLNLNHSYWKSCTHAVSVALAQELQYLCNKISSPF